MRIALLITGLSMGGAERQVVDLADQFAASGHEILLIALTGEVLVRPEHPAVQVENLAMSKTVPGFFDAYLKARGLLKAFRPAVVHSHMVHANLFARLLRLTTDIPKLINTAHNTNEGGYARMLAYRVTNYLADLSTNVSAEAVLAFEAKRATPPGKMKAVSNGIDIEQFQFNAESRARLRAELGVNDQTQLLLAVGRLTDAKDYPNLLRAFAFLRTAKSNVRLLIVGLGEQLGNLTHLSMELGIIEEVHFLGLRRDVSELMSAADLFVLSSAWEGMPLVLLEAMSCNCLVVATNCGGVKEVMGDTGLLIPPQDSRQLGCALLEALELPEKQRQEIGAAARSRIEQCYSLQATTKRWLSIYQGQSDV